MFKEPKETMSQKQKYENGVHQIISIKRTYKRKPNRKFAVGKYSSLGGGSKADLSWQEKNQGS